MGAAGGDMDRGWKDKTDKGRSIEANQDRRQSVPKAEGWLRSLTEAAAYTAKAEPEVI
jgi:hypothetical protein